MQNPRKPSAARVYTIASERKDLGSRKSLDSLSSTPATADNIKLRLAQKRGVARSASTTDCFDKEIRIKIQRLEHENVFDGRRGNEVAAAQEPIASENEQSASNRSECGTEISENSNQPSEEMEKMGTVEESQISRTSSMHSEDSVMDKVLDIPRSEMISNHVTNEDTQRNDSEESNIENKQNEIVCNSAAIELNDQPIESEKSDSMDGTSVETNSNVEIDTNMDKNELISNTEIATQNADQELLEQKLLEEETTDSSCKEADVVEIKNKEEVDTVCDGANMNTAEINHKENHENLERNDIEESIDKSDNNKYEDGSETDIGNKNDCEINTNDNHKNNVDELKDHKVKDNEEKLEGDEVMNEIEVKTANAGEEERSTAHIAENIEDDKSSEIDDEIYDAENPFEALIQAAAILNPRQFKLPREMSVFPQFPGDEKSEYFLQFFSKQIFLFFGLIY